ncbi:succinate dehydrogenase, cytochrome b subunit [uncultured Enterovirga sp.]|uniref:succinate dehydrogenase, cytochrome b556 subunit n=1 Tax=uncultured Enterovirga sp. TaxID=2026352 RepID=UPI0035CB4E90
MSARPIAYRRNLLWYAAMVHRLSGIGLAAFLPVHFLTLGLTLEGTARLDGVLRWGDMPAVKLAEAGLVFLLAVHLLGGLRVLFIENFTWRGNQAKLASAAGGLAALVAFAFLVRVL